MIQSDVQNETMLFNYATTYRTDYRHGEIREYPKTVLKTKPVHEKRTSFKSVNNVCTMSEWKGDVPPFSLTHAPKGIVRTNPFTVPKPSVIEGDVDKESVLKTRPRLVMAPAVSMDDIMDPVAREILIDDMYTSEIRRGTKEVIAALPRRKVVKAPLPDRPAPTKPISLPKHQTPLVSSEWRMESVSWDRKQLRAHCQSTELFWLARGPMEQGFPIQIK